MPYIGNTPADKFLTLAKQSFSTSATTSYTLDSAVSSTQDIALFINSVRQSPVDAYTVSGTALTLTSATAGTDEMYCVYLGKTVGTTTDPNAISLATSTNNQVVTVTGTKAITGETNLIYNGTIVGAGADGANADLGVGLHVKTADSGASVDAGGDELVIEGSGASGMSILSGTSSTGGIFFGDSGGNARSIVKYDHSTDLFKIDTAAATAFTMNQDGIINKPLQPCFFVYADQQSGVGSGTTDIPFANERFDLNADFSTPSFTAPVTGKYAFQFSVRIVNCQAGGNVSIYIQPSNAEIRAWRQDSDSKAMVYETASASLVIDMDANDTCKLQINSSVDSDFIIDGATHSTYFSGYLVA